MRWKMKSAEAERNVGIVAIVECAPGMRLANELGHRPASTVNSKGKSARRKIPCVGPRTVAAV